MTLFCQKNDVSDKSIREIFNAYKDIPKSADDYGIFWQFIQNNNKNYNRYLNDNSKLAKQTRSEFKEIVALLDSQTNTVINEKNKRLAEIFCGENYSNYIKGIVFETDNEEKNARAYPNGLIYVAYGLDKLLDTKKNVAGMMGIIAHEIAHCILSHVEVHNYSLKKKEKSNNTKKIIAQSLAGVVVAASEMAHASSGATYTEKNGEQYNSILQNSISVIDQAFDKNSHKYRFSYSREQEIESDIIACLYLIWIGENPNYYIEALELLRVYSADYIQSDNNTHPSIDFRINLLKEYFLKAQLYADKDGEVRVVLKYKEQRFKEVYPKSKKIKEDMFEKFSSENQVFLSKGKYYTIPSDKVSTFLQKRTDSQVIDLIE